MPQTHDILLAGTAGIVITGFNALRHGESETESKIWLGREDSNLRMPVPKTGALGHLATPHPKSPET